MSQLTYNPITTANVSASPSGLSRNGGTGVVSVVLSATPSGATLAVGTIVTLQGNTSVGGTNFNGSYPILALTDQTHFTYQQDAALGADTGGGGILYVSPAQFTDLLNTTLVQDKPITESILTKISHNAYFGTVRCEIFDSGYWIHGSSIPSPQSPVDGYFYSLAECTHIPIIGSTRQPVAVGSGYVLGQPTFPILSNSDAGYGDLILPTFRLYIDSNGLLTSSIYLGQSGNTYQGTVRVITIGQRLKGSLTFSAGAPSFTDLSDQLVRGGSFPTQTNIRALNDNAKYSAVRLEVFDKGYYGDGDTVALPVSPVDSYAYSRKECLYLVTLASSRHPLAGYTPGQLTFPTLASSDLGTGIMIASPFKMRVEGSSGLVTVQMYFWDTGAVGQGTVHVYCFAQRGANQAQA